MKCNFSHRRISAVVAVVPEEEFRFDEECAQYALTPEKARRFKKMMGVDRHRIAPAGVCASDLCLHGLRTLFDDGVVAREEIGALVFVSQTPDYFLPPTSNVIQGRLRLGRDVVCLDINQGCAGYVVGLLQAFLLLEIAGISKVALLCGDTASKQLSRRNRISYPLAGDAGSVTIVERCEEVAPVHMCLNMDGGRYDALIVPAGAYRVPSSPDTLQARGVEEGVERSLEHIHMDGPAVFNFTMEDVPPQIEEVLVYAGSPKESIDRFVFHQPNQFILKQMGAKLGIPEEKLPSHIVGLYGNCSSASIPLALAESLGAELLAARRRVCLSGFGVGLTWGSMVMEIGPLAACRVLDFRRDAPGGSLGQEPA